VGRAPHRESRFRQAGALDVPDRGLITAISTALTAEPIDVAAAIATVTAPDCGGIAVFVGTVRTSAAVAGHDHDVVEQLEYEAHPTLATEALDRIATKASERWDVRHVVAHHRTGTCRLGEATVVVACSAPHRADALEACRFMIDAIKDEVPIWKKEIYAGSSAWVEQSGRARTDAEQGGRARTDAEQSGRARTDA
jgi:molybdopterin synthase catalytic subunit